MAGSTPHKNSSRGYEGTGVPVLFSLKNVQPLILGKTPAKPEAGVAPQATTSPKSLETAPQTPQAEPAKVEVRRSSLVSQVATSVLVLLLLLVVLKYSVPTKKPVETVDAKSASPTEAQTAESLSGQSNSSQPDASQPNRDTTRLASRPLLETKIDLSKPQSSKDSSPPSLDLGLSNDLKLETPSIPPMLLSTGSPSNLPSSGTSQGAMLQLGEATPPAFQDEAVRMTNDSVRTNGAPTTSPQSFPPMTLPQELRASQLSVPQPTGSAQPKLNVVDTPTPESSLSELYEIYRKATEQKTPTKTVSGPATMLPQPVASPNSLAPTIPLKGEAYPPERRQYVPLSIPAYEQPLNTAPENRYQPIRQPRTEPSGGSQQPTPYKPVGPSLQNLPPATNVGYPPAQY